MFFVLNTSPLSCFSSHLNPFPAVFHLSESSPITAALTTSTASRVQGCLCRAGMMMTTLARSAAPWADVAAWDRSVLVWRGRTGIAFHLVFTIRQRPNNDFLFLFVWQTFFSQITSHFSKTSVSAFSDIHSHRRIRIFTDAA